MQHENMLLTLNRDGCRRSDLSLGCNREASKRRESVDRKSILHNGSRLRMQDFNLLLSAWKDSNSESSSRFAVAFCPLRFVRKFAEAAKSAHLAPFVVLPPTTLPVAQRTAVLAAKRRLSNVTFAPTATDVAAFIPDQVRSYIHVVRG